MRSTRTTPTSVYRSWNFERQRKRCLRTNVRYGRDHYPRGETLRSTTKKSQSKLPAEQAGKASLLQLSLVQGKRGGRERGSAVKRRTRLAPRTKRRRKKGGLEEEDYASRNVCALSCCGTSVAASRPSSRSAFICKVFRSAHLADSHLQDPARVPGVLAKYLSLSAN